MLVPRSETHRGGDGMLGRKFRENGPGSPLRAGLRAEGFGEALGTLALVKIQMTRTYMQEQPPLDTLLCKKESYSAIE